MGLGRDLLVLIGVLPIPRLDFGKKIRDETSEKTNYEKLSDLNGQCVWANDLHHGVVYGTLRYNPDAERYYLITPTKQEFPFDVHDLRGLGSRTID